MYEDYDDTENYIGEEEEEVEEEEVGQSCYYCGNKEKQVLVKCLDYGCDNYFCNNLASDFQAGSHIFNHLTIRSHNIIELPNKFKLNCFSCSSNNSFALCYNLTNQEIAVVCRTKCLVDNPDLRTIEWNGIFSEKVLDTNIVPQGGISVPVTCEEILQMEIKLTHGEMKNILDVGPTIYHKISLRYKNYEEYKNTFELLLELEHEYDKYYSSIEVYPQVKPEWDLDYKRFSYNFSEEKCNFNLNDEVCITSDGFKAGGIITSISPEGLVTVELLKKKTGNNLITNIKVKSVYSDIAYERMIRALKSFKNIEENIKNLILGYDITLPEQPDIDIEDFSVPNLPSLNNSQNEAVRIALKSGLSLIQGPPGTGKTVTTATIVYHLSKILNKPNQFIITQEKIDKCEEVLDKLFKKTISIGQEITTRKSILESVKKSQDCTKNPQILIKLQNWVDKVLRLQEENEKETLKYSEMKKEYEYRLSLLNPDTFKKLILVCAPSNVAVDHLVEKIDITGIKVIRIYSKSREDHETEFSHLSYHKIFNKHLEDPENFELKILYNQKKNGELAKPLKCIYNKLESKLRDKIVKDVDVICCTCIGALDQRLSGLRFEKVIIDEACQAQEPEVLIPLLFKPDQVVMVGDHFQLGPIIKCKQAEKAGLENSLFRRLVDLGHKSYMLSIQYRMHPSIAAFPSYTFYNDKLENGVTREDRENVYTGFPWPAPAPIFFYNIQTIEEHSSTGKSYVNRIEANAVVKIIEKLGPESEIGVITFYDAQRVTISKYVKDLKGSGFNLEISSVDSFQGREKDFIILSCVRSNQRSGIGFLGNYRRLNVAITRAKYGLIICGNAFTLQRSPLWNSLLDFYQKNNLIYQGDLDNLYPLNIQLSPNNFSNFDAMFPYAEPVESSA